MNYDEGELIQEALDSGLPCDLDLPTYNDALSLQAHLNRYIRTMKGIYAGTSNNEFEDLEVTLLKPKTLRFNRRTKPKLRQVGTSPE